MAGTIEQPNLEDTPQAAAEPRGARWAGLTAPELRDAYGVALETRASIVSCMGLKGRGEGVEFWIGGPGEEVHGVATALAFHYIEGGGGAAGQAPEAAAGGAADRLLSSLTLLVGTLGRGALGQMIEERGYFDVFILTTAIGMFAVLLCIIEWVRQARSGRPQNAPPPDPDAVAAE